MAELQINLAGIPLRNPVVAAAGTAGYVDELSDALDLSRIGAVVSKSITLHSREGNPPWRIIDLPAGMLNAIGLANVGLERFIEEKLPAASRLDAVLIGSIAGHGVEEYIAVAEAFDERPELPIVELNVSCPNTAKGLVFGENVEALSALLREVRPALRRTRMFVKLSPNVANVTPLAAAAVDAGTDGLTLINTLTGMSIDVHTRRPRLSNRTGGLSGPAIHPLAVRMVDEVYRAVTREAGVPIIGLGGVLNWRDAAELILAGASAVGMGTALFVDPKLAVRVVDGLDRWVEKQGCASVNELVGALKEP